MNYMLVSLAFTSILYLVVDGQDYQSNLVRISYEKHRQKIEEAYSYYEKNEMKLGEEDVCIFLSQEIANLKHIGDVKIGSKIKRGAFENDTDGFILILENHSTIDIPAVIECTTKDIINEDVVYGGKAFIYYYIMYMNNDEFMYARVERYDKQISNSNKLVFRLKNMESITAFQATYNNRTAKRFIEKWFKKAKNHQNMALKKCLLMSCLGQAAERTDAEWEVVSGQAITGDFSVRLTETIEVQIFGVIKCEVKPKNSSSKDTNVNYYTMTYEKGKEGLALVFGPVIVNKKQTFTITQKMHAWLIVESEKVKA